MRYLNAGDNKLIFTLTEKTLNLVNPYYTFRLVKKDTNEETMFFSFDNSTSPYYNSFTLSVVTQSISPTNSRVDLDFGEYNYFAYEKSVPYSLTYSNSDNLVEYGIINYYGPTNSLVEATYVPPASTQEIKRYRPTI
ncbi:hypothetical protein UFOVP695_15 [uncultured Caudovirales phage]|uniref:Uncharacterized protein n=1 Tax=uncultured Caudovirales phage TaxID=2100421 RepID=A0A6J5NHC6_9CAUD|nr:hypothetical protein UFOVP695_15 [uncultured Caudovirales phage]